MEFSIGNKFNKSTFSPVRFVCLNHSLHEFNHQIILFPSNAAKIDVFDRSREWEKKREDWKHIFNTSSILFVWHTEEMKEWMLIPTSMLCMFFSGTAICMTQKVFQFRLPRQVQDVSIHLLQQCLTNTDRNVLKGNGYFFIGREHVVVFIRATYSRLVTSYVNMK